MGFNNLIEAIMPPSPMREGVEELTKHNCYNASIGSIEHYSESGRVRRLSTYRTNADYFPYLYVDVIFRTPSFCGTS